MHLYAPADVGQVNKSASHSSVSGKVGDLAEHPGPFPDDVFEQHSVVVVQRKLNAW